MFRGSASATIDGKGRLKIPVDFRRRLAQAYDEEVFITSLDGESAHIYPLPVWEEHEAKLLELPSTDRARIKYLDRVNYWGQQVRLDSQGRVLIPQLLRDRAAMSGEVVVSGRIDHLVVWNHERFVERLERQTFGDEELDRLSSQGI